MMSHVTNMMSHVTHVNESCHILHLNLSLRTHLEPPLQVGGQGKRGKIEAKSGEKKRKNSRWGM